MRKDITSKLKYLVYSVLLLVFLLVWGFLGKFTNIFKIFNRLQTYITINLS